jgi:hypothetical protein
MPSGRIRALDKELFPAAECIAAAGELSAWTSVQDIAAAARFLEGRLVKGDLPETRLIIPIVTDAKFEWVLRQAIKWFVAGYRVPSSKIMLAIYLDPAIRRKTNDTLLELRLHPQITKRLLHTLVSRERRSGTDQQVLLIQDHVAAIEVMQAPLRCLIDIVLRCYETSQKMYNLISGQEEAGGSGPTIWHRPYTDSPLFAVLEALCFYRFDLTFGPLWGRPGPGDIDMAYRAINIRGVPPFDSKMLQVAREVAEKMFDDLR